MSSIFVLFAAFSVLSGNLAKRTESEHGGSDTIAEVDRIASTKPAHADYGDASFSPGYSGKGGKGGSYHKVKKAKPYNKYNKYSERYPHGKHGHKHGKHGHKHGKHGHKYGKHGYKHGKHGHKYGGPSHQHHRCNTACGATSWKEHAFDVTIKQLHPFQCANCKWQVNLGECRQKRPYTLIRRPVSKACCLIIDGADECNGRYGSPLVNVANAPSKHAKHK
eukprot:TRINITY_DN3519_c0_g1_i1.p1 TRINITY_DN3519_c0_g1~~TRINITY_DN3519_c0_g1_i1.p1  ORF type:complete len:221 (+),score=21.35 TRINITY_DN3519_c0_g1_i1:80-742(+)